MRRRTWVALSVSMALLLSCTLQTGRSQNGQAKEGVMESVLTMQTDPLGGRSAYGYVPVYKSILNTKDLGSSRSKMSNDRLQELPASYDARKEGLMTEIKDQGQLFMCWAFAAMGAMETNILQKELEAQPDLSEYHLAYSAYNKAPDPLVLTEEDVVHPREMNNDIYTWGGNAYMATSALARWQGAVAEETAPMTVLKRLVDTGQTARLSDDIMYGADRYHLQNTEFIYMTEENRDLIKRKLMEFGAASIGMYAPETKEDEKLFSNTGTNEFTAYYCNDASMQTNHEVMLVGWDDTFAVSNFNLACRPSGPGAWLIRNSWGDYNELGGYFWLSYEDTMLQAGEGRNAEASFFDVEPVDNYNWNYQYDGGMPLGYIKGCDSIANVYTSRQNEKLQAVSFYTQERNVKYTISVYKLLDGEDPTSGIRLGETLSGTVDERGYHTIDFTRLGESDIALSKGDRFSVVLQLTDSAGAGSYYTIESGMGFSQLEEKVDMGEGESFILSGKKWRDCADPSVGYGANFCLKAFTSSVQPGEIPQETSAPAAPTAEPAPNTLTPPGASNTPGTPHTPAESVPPIEKDPVILVVENTKPIVKKLTFKPGTKTVRAGKKLKLSNYLKVTKRRSSTPKITYEFTKKKYKKYASLSSKGVIKAKQAGRKKVVYVRARAKDGSKKTAKIKIKIK